LYDGKLVDEFITSYRQVLCFRERNQTESIASMPFSIGVRTSSLDELFLESVTETLSDLVGAHARDALFEYFERNCSLPRDQIPKQSRMFFATLEEISGKGGKTIGRAIVRRLFEKLCWDFHEIPGFEPEDYLDTVKSRLKRQFAQEYKALESR